jgi:hypothetical protein
LATWYNAPIIQAKFYTMRELIKPHFDDQIQKEFFIKNVAKVIIPTEDHEFIYSGDVWISFSKELIFSTHPEDAPYYISDNEESA